LRVASIALAAGAGAAAFWILGVFQFLRSRRLTKKYGLRLSDVDPVLPAGESWPKVSILVPARNEAAAIETAVRSLLAQDYPDLEVVAVDDRSEDATGAILRRVAAEDARLTVVRVDALPSGWLGKNHANREGAARAGGDWLLFTDGDVKFGIDTVRRAVAFARRRRFGHVVALPHCVTEEFLESAFVSVFGLFFAIKFRLWELPRARTGAYIGSGTFNMVRREDYARCGGHERLRLEVADDIKLGLILRRAGTSQGVVDSCGGVSVRWQEGFLATMRGLVKNAFSGMEWRWDVALASAAGLFFVSVLPAILLLAAPAPLKPWLAIPVILPMVFHGAAARSSTDGSGLEGLSHPLMALTFIGVILWSACAATWRGGISWRGTRYGLAELRAGCVRESDYPLDAVVGWDDA
jgi:hypothetical protein